MMAATWISSGRQLLSVWGGSIENRGSWEYSTSSQKSGVKQRWICVLPRQWGYWRSKRDGQVAKRLAAHYWLDGGNRSPSSDPTARHMKQIKLAANHRYLPIVRLRDALAAWGACEWSPVVCRLLASPRNASDQRHVGDADTTHVRAGNDRGLLRP